MRRKKLPPDLMYNIPEDLKQYGGWDYVQNLVNPDPNLFSVFVNKYGVGFARSKLLDANAPVKKYFKYIKHDTPDFKALSAKFDEYKNDNPWVEEFYKFCFSKSHYAIDPFDPEEHWVYLNTNFNSHHTPNDINRSKLASDYYQEKLDYARFNMICGRADSLLIYYNEIKRPIPFVVGNIVRLRKKCIGSRHHDPFYRKSDLKDEERVGHITAILDDTHSNSYNGKGSRLVQVYWAASGEINKQSVGSLKLLDQKNNKMVDKLVDE